MFSMKKIFIVISALLTAISTSAQVDNTHFELSLSLGKGNQISKGQYNTTLEKQFYDELGKQTAFDISFGSYFQPQNSLGVEIFLDLGIGRSSISGASGQLYNGTLGEGFL